MYFASRLQQGHPYRYSPAKTCLKASMEAMKKTMQAQAVRKTNRAKVSIQIFLELETVD